MHAGLEKAVTRKLEDAPSTHSTQTTMSGMAKHRFKTVAQRFLGSSSIRRPASYVNLAQLAEAAGESDAKVCTCANVCMYVCVFVWIVRSRP
jgi:hypothetical protein